MIPDPTRKKAVEAKSRFSLHQVVLLIREVDFCIDLGDDQEGADHFREKKLSAAHPQVGIYEKSLSFI